MIERFSEEEEDTGTSSNGGKSCLEKVEQKDIILVAHNGNHFEIPFLFKSFEIHGIVATGLSFKGQIDKLSLDKFSITASMIRLVTRR